MSGVCHQYLPLFLASDYTADEKTEVKAWLVFQKESLVLKQKKKKNLSNICIGFG